MIVSISIYKIINTVCKAIKERHLLHFYYESKTRKAWRTIRPYMIIPNNLDKLELVGLPIDQLNKSGKKETGHYLLIQLDMEQFEVLDETFSDPGVPRSWVVITKKPPVCRFIYDDEDKKEVIKSWEKIEVIK